MDGPHKEVFRNKGKVIRQRKKEKIEGQGARYIIINGKFYKKSFIRLSMKCLREENATYALKEVTKKVCENHLGVRTIA